MCHRTVRAHWRAGAETSDFDAAMAVIAGNESLTCPGDAGS